MEAIKKMVSQYTPEELERRENHVATPTFPELEKAIENLTEEDMRKIQERVNKYLNRMTKTETKEEGTIMPYFKLSKNEFGKMWLLYKPEKDTSGGCTGRYSCWEPINEEFWNEFEKLVHQTQKQ